MMVIMMAMRLMLMMRKGQYHHLDHLTRTLTSIHSFCHRLTHHHILRMNRWMVNHGVRPNHDKETRQLEKKWKPNTTWSGLEKKAEWGVREHVGWAVHHHRKEAVYHEQSDVGDMKLMKEDAESRGTEESEPKKAPTPTATPAVGEKAKKKQAKKTAEPKKKQAEKPVDATPMKNTTYRKKAQKAGA